MQVVFAALPPPELNPAEPRALSCSLLLIPLHSLVIKIRQAQYMTVPCWALTGPYCKVNCRAVLQIDYITSSSRSALRAVFASWSLEEGHAWLSRDIGLQLVLEDETRKWFPASNSGREVSLMLQLPSG